MFVGKVFSEEDGYGVVTDVAVCSVSVRFAHRAGLWGAWDDDRREYARTFSGEEIMMLLTSEQMDALTRNRNRSGDGKTNLAFRRKRLDMAAQVANSLFPSCRS